MKTEIEKIYQLHQKNKKEILRTKNKHIAIIYKGLTGKTPVDKIRKELKNNVSVSGDIGIILLATSLKLLKSVTKFREQDDILAETLIKKSEIIKVVANSVNRENTESQKIEEVKSEIDENRLNNKWFYLASSHTDCAKDHKPYQGKMYFDEKSPEPIQKYAKRKGFKTIQWVMGKPAWFITRPNCRHYFHSLTYEQVSGHSIKDLIGRYNTHSAIGNRELSTPRHQALEEYEDRLKMLKAMYREHKSELLRKKIEKTEMLIKKWKNRI